MIRPMSCHDDIDSTNPRSYQCDQNPESSTVSEVRWRRTKDYGCSYQQLDLRSHMLEKTIMDVLRCHVSKPGKFWTISNHLAGDPLLEVSIACILSALTGSPKRWDKGSCIDMIQLNEAPYLENVLLTFCHRWLEYTIALWSAKRIDTPAQPAHLND